MNCPLRDQHLQVGLSDEENAALVAHARSCAQCSRRRATLERSRAVMQSALPEFDTVAASRWLARAKGQRQAQRPWALPVAVAVAFAAAVFAFVSLKTPATTPSAAPHIAVADLATNEMIKTKTARWVALNDFRLARLPSLDRDVMRIDSGHLEVQLLDPAQTAVVETQVGVIELEGGQYELRIDRQAAVLRIDNGHAVLRRGDQSLRFGHPNTVQFKAGQWPPTSQPPRTKKAAEPAEPVGAVVNADEASAAARRMRRPKAARRRHRQRLTEARALLGQDNQKAVALAEALISDNPGTAPIEASMIAADGYRRRGEARKAERLYQQVAAHPDGTQFADEALTRRAVSLAARGLDTEALAALKQARLRFDNQGLAPERAALEARIHLRANRVSSAANTLLPLSDRRDRVLNAPRLETATALPDTDPRRVRLLESVVQGGGPRAERARELLTSEKKSNGP